MMRSIRLLVLVLATSCEKAATGGPPLRDVTPQQFGELRWLAGTWRGMALLPGGDQVGAPFYEVWRAVDDSTLIMHRYGDSALASSRDSVRIELRSGSVYYRSDRPVMMAIGIASRGATFFPEGESRGGVTISTQHACRDTLVPATSPCPTRGDTSVVQGRSWWIATWHTGPVAAFGFDAGKNDRSSYSPVWRQSPVEGRKE